MHMFVCLRYVQARQCELYRMTMISDSKNKCYTKECNTGVSCISVLQDVLKGLIHDGTVGIANWKCLGWIFGGRRKDTLRVILDMVEP